MRLYAIVDNNIVVNVISIEEDVVSSISREHQLVIDIEDMAVRPCVGWHLEGTKFLVGEDQNGDKYYNQQKTQREMGIRLAAEVADLIGARNLKLSAEGNSINVATVLQQLSTLKALLEAGCLRTTLLVVESIIPAFPVYSDIFSYAKNYISNFLKDMGY